MQSEYIRFAHQLCLLPWPNGSCTVWYYIDASKWLPQTSPANRKATNVVGRQFSGIWVAFWGIRCHVGWCFMTLFSMCIYWDVKDGSRVGIVGSWNLNFHTQPWVTVRGANGKNESTPHTAVLGYRTELPVLGIKPASSVYCDILRTWNSLDVFTYQVFP